MYAHPLDRNDGRLARQASPRTYIQLISKRVVRVSRRRTSGDIGSSEELSSMVRLSEQQILDALKAVQEPSTGRDIVSLGMVDGLVIKDGNVYFAIEVEPSRAASLEPMRRAAESAVERLEGVLSVTAALTAHAPPA